MNTTYRMLLLVVAMLAWFTPTAHARWYDPTTGRWTTRDPAGYVDGANLYQYVVSNPLKYVDQNGRQASQPRPPINFPGGPGKLVDHTLRDLPDTATPADPNCPPGGREVPGTGGTHQNCAGRSCGIVRWINWPHLGGPQQANPNGCDDTAWNKAKSFVPQGCEEVSCEGVSTAKTRCPDPCDVELILFLYRWQTHQRSLPPDQHGPPSPIYTCDFHMIGRNPGRQKFWDSKQDRRNIFDCITDPDQSLQDAYPDRNYPTNREVVKRCFCCQRSNMGI